MSLVNKPHWNCDYGIPVVVSRSVYNKFKKYAANGAPYLESIEGVIHLHEDLPFSQLLPKAIGAQLSKESESTLRYRPGLPRCYLHVTSPLLLKAKYNNSHPDATAWTMFQTNLKREPFRYTYTTFNPLLRDSVDEAVEFINWYVKDYDGKMIVTDFDGMLPRLEANIPINTNLNFHVK